MPCLTNSPIGADPILGLSSAELVSVRPMCTRAPVWPRRFDELVGCWKLVLTRRVTVPDQFQDVSDLHDPRALWPTAVFDDGNDCCWCRTNGTPGSQRPIRQLGSSRNPTLNSRREL